MSLLMRRKLKGQPHEIKKDLKCSQTLIMSSRSVFCENVGLTSTFIMLSNFGMHFIEHISRWWRHEWQFRNCQYVIEQDQMYANWLLNNTRNDTYNFHCMHGVVLMFLKMFSDQWHQCLLVNRSKTFISIVENNLC
jgi:hypothetical protein